MLPTQFVFGDPIRSGFEARIPPGIESKEYLCLEVGVALHFPDYYGVNWDAMDECISDLAWLPFGDVVLNHVDVPLERDPEASRIYLEVLRDAVKRWDGTRGRRLLITFPAGCEERVARLLGDA